MLALSAVCLGAATTPRLAPFDEISDEDRWTDLYNCIWRVDLKSEVLKKLLTCGWMKIRCDGELQSCTKTPKAMKAKLETAMASFKDSITGLAAK